MANAEDLNALIAAAENSSATQQLAQLLPSSSIVRAQRLKSIQTNLGSLFSLCGHDDPDKLENSTYGFDLRLARTEKDHITPGLTSSPQGNCCRPAPLMNDRLASRICVCGQRSQLKEGIRRSRH